MQHIAPILIVDDNRQMITMLSQILREVGFSNIVGAEDAEQAADRIRNSRPRAILTDWTLPDCSGLDLVSWIRRAPDTPDPKAPVLIVTNDTRMGNVVAARDAGASGFLKLPISPRDVMLRMNAVLADPREFVQEGNYVGPCRRRVHDEVYFGPRRRQRDREIGAPAPRMKDPDPLVVQVTRFERLARNIDLSNARDLARVREVGVLVKERADALGRGSVAIMIDSLTRYIDGVDVGAPAEARVFNLHLDSLVQVLTNPRSFADDGEAIAKSLTHLVSKRLGPEAADAESHYL